MFCCQISSFPLAGHLHLAPVFISLERCGVNQDCMLGEISGHRIHFRSHSAALWDCTWAGRFSREISGCPGSVWCLRDVLYGVLLCLLSYNLSEGQSLVCIFSPTCHIEGAKMINIYINSRLYLF